MGPWVIIGKFKEGKKVLATAQNITDACYAVQSNHFKHMKDLKEIWYQSKKIWEEDNGAVDAGRDTRTVIGEGGQRCLFPEFEVP